MALFKRIAVAIDGSPTSRVALRAAIALAQDQKAALRTILVVDVITGTMDSPYDMADYEDSVRRGLSHLFLGSEHVDPHRTRPRADSWSPRASRDRVN